MNYKDMKAEPGDKIAPCVDGELGFRGQYLWWCAGCDEFHGVWTEHPNKYTNAIWTFNGNPKAPTFQPSILTNVGRANPAQHLCHVFIAEGKIQYLGDCTHKLAGQTIVMTDIHDTWIFKDHGEENVPT